MTPETRFKNQVEKYLNEHRILHFRNQMNSDSGLPDITAIYKGFYIGIELKREDGKGRATKQQEDIIELIKNAGGIAGVVDSMHDLELLLKQAEDREK